ncbi:hypothetical protein B9479_006242 [Cryptococcus floricola]|uniref:Chromo domain-containing protein n=1 Tax=Cryptococcus floricola TaxID=2591691 RepID=A0A5D3ASU7_9TREE|nr:hypothetical protein B9479_006242 [Cryptococcus floricola]
MPESTPADSNASKDTQSTLFPPDSRVSGVSSNDDKHRHMCYCAMHLEPGESDEPSWTGGRPISNNDIDIARIHFGSDREPTIFESTCTRATIILSFRDDDLPEDEELVGYVTKSDLDEMGLWPMYRDVFKTATGVECGLLVEGENPCVHPVFHVSLLEPYRSRAPALSTSSPPLSRQLPKALPPSSPLPSSSSSVSSPPPTPLPPSPTAVIVDSAADRANGLRYYLQVRADDGYDYRSWVPSSQLPPTDPRVRLFHRTNPDKPGYDRLPSSPSQTGRRSTRRRGRREDLSHVEIPEVALALSCVDG